MTRFIFTSKPFILTDELKSHLLARCGGDHDLYLRAVRAMHYAHEEKERRRQLREEAQFSQSLRLLGGTREATRRLRQRRALEAKHTKRIKREEAV